MAKILIVEDDEMLNRVYKFILEKQGHRVTAVFNGAEGLKAAKRTRPDVILLDMLMPEMNGLAFLQEFNPSKHPKTSVLILTNLDEDDQVREAQELGAVGYILKASTSPSELVTHINKVL